MKQRKGKRKMKIKHVFAQNFCKFTGTKTIDFDFLDKTIVSGANEAGKSTIKTLIYWILNCRDENGKEITGIRPHDKDGVYMENVETVGAVTFDIDGEEKTMKKVFRQNINKKGEFTGNVTDYYVNDIPKKATDYADFISERIVSVGKLPYCINAMTLLLKNSTEQRALLHDTFGQHTDVDICDMFPEFEPLKAILSDGTIEELKKRCNKQLNGARGKNGSKGLNDLLDEIPSRIDEVSRQKVDLDFAELELQKNEILERIAQIDKSLSDNEALLKEEKKKSDGILELKFKISELQNEANRENDKKRADIRSKISRLEREREQLNSEINDLTFKEKYLSGSILTKEEDRKNLAEKWKVEHGRVFDDSTLICPYCGQEYPEDKKDQLKAEFQQHKADELKRIEEEGMNLKSYIDDGNAEISKMHESIEEKNTELQMILDEIANLNAEYNAIPAVVDISDTEEVKAIQKQISEMESAMKKENSIDDIRVKYKAEKDLANAELSEVQAKIAKSAFNAQLDDRIVELEEEKREIAQKITDVQAQLDLLKKFSRKKNELLEADVNGYLNFCKVKMFRPLINGDTEECCEFIYNGEPYGQRLNHGARILVEIDICRAFQKKYGVEIPIIVDDTESVDDWRIPKIESQLVLLKRTDDKELSVKGV